MVEIQVRHESGDWLFRAIIGTAIALTLIHLLLIVFWGPGAGAL